KDLKPEFGAPLPVTVCFVPDKKYPNHYPIAIDKVHYVGEPVAIVLASSRAAAEDAGERIEVNYESLPAVVDIEKAIEAGAPVLHEELGSNLSYDVKFAAGDAEAAFKEAEVTIKQRLIQQRLIPIAIETRGVLADYKTFANKLTVWSSTQIPHFVKVWLAVILGIQECNVRVVAPVVREGRIHDEGLRRTGDWRLHEHHADRCLPWCRPPGGDLPDRTGDGPGSSRDGRGPGRGPAEELRSGAGPALHDAARVDL